jgi:hypothetical protein
LNLGLEALSAGWVIYDPEQGTGQEKRARGEARVSRIPCSPSPYLMSKTTTKNSGDDRAAAAPGREHIPA